MQKRAIVFTVIMALLLMGCPPPVSDNPDDLTSEVNNSAQNGDKPNVPASEVTDSASGGNAPNAPAPGGPDLEPKDIVVPYVSAGEYYTMIVKSDDTLWAVGKNDYGQLGNNDNTRDDQLNPIQVMTNVAQVSAGSRHTMILTKENTLWGTGDNIRGQLGTDTIRQTSTLVQIISAEGEPMTEVAQASVGEHHSIILKKNSDLWAVGNNSYGQLGIGTIRGESTPVQVISAEGKPMTEVDQVSVGPYRTMILKTNGELWAVGRNRKGQLGIGDDAGANQSTPVQVMIAAEQPMTNVIQVSAGSEHTMILKRNGDLWAVGRNNKGQLGDGSKTNTSTPVQVIIAEDQPITEVAQVSAGKFHTMILKRNGELWAVGRNKEGQLGIGTTRDASTPVQVMIAAEQPMTEVIQVSAGGYHSMIVKRNGTVWAVGKNDHGQLGNGQRGDDVVEVLPVEITIQ